VNSKYLTSVSVLQQLPVIQSGHIFNPISTLHNPVSDMETERRGQWCWRIFVYSVNSTGYPTAASVKMLSDHIVSYRVDLSNLFRPVAQSNMLQQF